MNNTYETIRDALLANFRTLGKKFSIYDMRRVLEKSNPQTFASSGTLDERFHAEIEKIFNEVLWDFLRDGVLVPAIESASQSNAYIGFGQFFVRMDCDSRVSNRC